MKLVKKLRKKLYALKDAEYRKEGLKWIISEEGCELRMKQSIQAKAILLALTPNMRKLHNKIQADRTGTHLLLPKKSL